MHAPDATVPEETPPSGTGWRDVARVTFYHHLRGPWAVALGIVGFLPAVTFSLWQLIAPQDIIAARELLPFLAHLVYAVLPLLLLLLVVPAYRGAWLRDPGAARERVIGFHVGTWAATVAALLPWLILAFSLAVWKATVLAAALATLVHFSALALLAAVWIALGMLLAVTFRREETRWVGVGMTYLTLGVVLPDIRALVDYAWRTLGTSGFSDPGSAWTQLLVVLDPNRLSVLFAASLAPGFDIVPSGDYAASLLLDTPWGTLALLAIWTVLPLILAMRIQSRTTDDLPPLEQPF